MKILLLQAIIKELTVDEQNIVKNSPKAWLLAARPKTLSGAAVPVMIGTAFALHDSWIYENLSFKPLAAVLCFLFAFVMQIDANFINDYFDYLHGNDNEERLGPKRACSMGWVTIEAMRKAILFTTLLACLIGLPLIWYGGWQMILVGIVCVIFCFLYTTHLSYLGLGDLLVLLFFGIVPVCFTYYVQHQFISGEVLWASVSCGIVIDALLMINNYRDIHNDERCGKRTLAVRLGARNSRIVYLAIGFVAFLMGIFYLLTAKPWAFLLPIIYLFLHIQTYRKMVVINEGRALNRILGETARNIFIYGVLLTAGILL